MEEKSLTFGVNVPVSSAYWGIKEANKRSQSWLVKLTDSEVSQEIKILEDIPREKLTVRGISSKWFGLIKVKSTISYYFRALGDSKSEIICHIRVDGTMEEATLKILLGSVADSIAALEAGYVEGVQETEEKISEGEKESGQRIHRRKCPNCGSMIRIEDDYCMNCGKELEKAGEN